jgi:hypothetical protein
MPVDVGGVSSESLGRSDFVEDQIVGSGSHHHSVGLQHGKYPLGNSDLPKRGRMDVVDHHQIACLEVLQRDQQSSRHGCDRLDQAVGLRHLDLRARAPKVPGDGECHDPLAASMEELEGPAEIRRPRVLRPIIGAHVVDADVQAAELITGVGIRAAGQESRDLGPDHIFCPVPVDGVAGEGQP